MMQHVYSDEDEERKMGVSAISDCNTAGEQVALQLAEATVKERQDLLFHLQFASHPCRDLSQCITFTDL